MHKIIWSISPKNQYFPKIFYVHKPCNIEKTLQKTFEKNVFFGRKIFENRFSRFFQNFLGKYFEKNL